MQISKKMPYKLLQDHNFILLLRFQKNYNFGGGKIDSHSDLFGRETADIYWHSLNTDNRAISPRNCSICSSFYRSASQHAGVIFSPFHQAFLYTLSRLVGQIMSEFAFVHCIRKIHPNTIHNQSVPLRH